MLFNSQVFLIFFVVIYALYLLSQKRVKLQNTLLLVASYIFYGYWDWRFLSLIALSTFIDFYIGKSLGAVEGDTPADLKRRKILLFCSVGANLGILGFFKYFNFFTDSFAEMLNLFGLQADPITLNIILPVGISFYTFQTMSYTIDIYRNQLKPTQSLLDFAVFVSFFPQLVAGPIERAVNLLPQVEQPRRITMEHFNAGLFLILWGYFKKVVIADNTGEIANLIFNNYTTYSGFDLVIGVLAFAIQIYGDFSGYSDIARGISRLMGFELMINFRLPYFALNPTDFWQRWHISLSTWLKDYLYIPLGGNRKGDFATYRNLFLTMLLGGLWHGASWNFVIWGAFHGLILILYRKFEKRPAHADPWGGEHSYLVVVAKMALMFVLTLLGWLFFRASTAHQIGYMLTHISLVLSPEGLTLASSLLFFSLPLLVVQVFQYITRDLLILPKLPALARVPVYSFLLIWALIFGTTESAQFIYFQF
jgi:D-alanyl-lipoteichoic acid acyltransferase DltB (MBOAT superfamily)